MKKVIFACLVAVIAVSAEAKGGRGGGSHSYSGSHGHYTGTGSNSHSHYVHGYTRQNGTYVAPHHNTNPNHTQRDNYGTIGNYNPHNGQYGKNYANH